MEYFNNDQDIRRVLMQLINGDTPGTIRNCSATSMIPC